MGAQKPLPDPTTISANRDGGAAFAHPRDCATCGFRGEHYSDEQAVGSLLLTGAFLRGVLSGVDLTVANTRPDDHTWSILEYVDHIRSAAWIWRFVVDAARQGLDLDLTGDDRPGISAVHQRFDDVDETIASAEAESTELFTLLLALPVDAWAIASVVAPYGTVDQHWIVRHLRHEVAHHLHDVGRLRVALGDGVPTQSGAVTQISRGDGGVPKTAVDDVEVTPGGLVGDRQTDRVHHGRPFQAVCLYSADVIEALNAEGHGDGGITRPTRVEK